MWFVTNRRVLRALHKMELNIMSNFQDLADDLAGIAADVAPLQERVGELTSTVAQLQLQLSNAGAVLPNDAQRSLDAAVQQAADLKGKFDGMVAGLTQTTNAAKVSAENPPVEPKPVVTANQAQPNNKTTDTGPTTLEKRELDPKEGINPVPGGVDPVTGVPLSVDPTTGTPIGRTSQGVAPNPLPDNSKDQPAPLQPPPGELAPKDGNATSGSQS